MRRFFTVWSLRALLLCLSVQSCTPTAALQQSPIEGKIIGDRYYDPTGTFSVTVMSQAFNRVINEAKMPNKESIGVSFQNDFGSLSKVEVLVGVKPKFMEMAPLEHHNSIFFEITYDHLLSFFPGTKVLEKKEVEVEGIGTVCAGVILIPRGSTLTCLETMIPEDSIRAFIISYDHDNLVIVSVQEPLSTGPFGRNDETANELLINTAIEFRKTYRNQSTGH